MTENVYHVEIYEQVEVEEAWIGLLKTAVSQTLTHEKVAAGAELTLVLTHDDELQKLNKQYRQQDKPTDILSFPAQAQRGMEHYLGDILISVPYATRHAKEDGHTLLEELQLLAVHGTLHLLGHDDLEDEAKKVMWVEQTAVLNKLSLHLNIPE